MCVRWMFLSIILAWLSLLVSGLCLCRVRSLCGVGLDCGLCLLVTLCTWRTCRWARVLILVLLTLVCRL